MSVEGSTSQSRAMSQLRWDQAVALAVVACGVVEYPRVCLCLAVSWLSWDTVISCEVDVLYLLSCMSIITFSFPLCIFLDSWWEV